MFRKDLKRRKQIKTKKGWERMKATSARAYIGEDSILLHIQRRAMNGLTEMKPFGFKRLLSPF